jgi:uncharacterized membrane protein YgcG
MRLLLLVGVYALLCAPHPAPGQTYDESAAVYDIECPGSFNAYFRGYREGVYYWGKEWLSTWFASSPERPLPSRTWYYAYPNRDVISTDNTAIWKWAEIRVHCWVYRSLYAMVIHYDPIDFGGYPSTIPSDPDGGGCGGGGEYMTSISPGETAGSPQHSFETTSEYYDPYNPGCDDGGSGGGGGSDGDGGGGGGGGGSFGEMCTSLGGKLYYDFVCLEQWNDKTGDYETVWCGTAAICDT